MGTNSAPHMANIYLAEYEYKFIKKLELSNKTKELQLHKNIFRFQDDLLVLNDDGYFNTIFQEIYPVEMVLKETNVSPHKVNFLDITISIYQEKYRYECYDKRNDFNFNVISFPLMSGNLPHTQMHGLFLSQLVRYCYTNSTFSSFLKCSKKLYNKLVTQGLQPDRLQKNFNVRRGMSIEWKINDGAREMMQLLYRQSVCARVCVLVCACACVCACVCASVCVRVCVC